MHPATACAITLVETLQAQGVREVVVCPGSRSAALAYAVQDADRAGRLRMHVRVDERSAAFLALGLAKLGGPPTAVVTTSGTALANLHPAVLEASHAAVPLLVLSADRPPELRSTGANQTTDQVRFFAGAVRWSHDLGTPAQGDDPAVWRAVAARAYAAATGWGGSAPGPVHLNLPMREPLVPDLVAAAPDGADESASADPVVRPMTRPVTRSATGPVITAEPRTLVVLGDLPAMLPGAEAPAGAVVELAARRGWPVVAEPFGRFDRSRAVAHGSLVLSAAEWVERHRPERVLVVGRPTLSRAVAALLRGGSAVDVVSAQPQWSDPGAVARTVYPWASVPASLQSSVSAAASAEPPADSDWRRTWDSAGGAVAAAVAPVIRQSWPSGPAVAAALLGALPPAAALFVGSSNPVRDLDLALPGPVLSGPVLSGPLLSGPLLSDPLLSRTAPPDVTVVANRGLAGIDGCVSTAAGVALRQAGRTYALMGDLTFLHDANGLLIGPGEPRPNLTVVVVNDDGGGIFTLLEPGEDDRARDFERVFGTPTGTVLADLCRAYGVRHQRADSPEALAAAVGEAPNGLRVVEVPVERGSHRGLQRRLREAAATALG